MLKVKTSTIRGAGKGLFATRTLKPNTPLGEYTGRRTKKHPTDGSYTWQVNMYDDNGKFSHLEFIDAKKDDRCVLRYVNGAATAAQRRRINTAMYQYAGRVFYKTLKRVRKGEELIMSYGSLYEF